MSILLSGDFHANADHELPLITRESLVKKYGKAEYDAIKYHVILGDGGFLWPGNEENEYINYWALSQRPFPILCVMGNHDPVLGRWDLPEIDIGIGEKVIVVHETKPLAAYLKRGRVYHIDNRKFLVLGGALSIDRYRRQPNVSWWENEYWSKEEETGLFALLEKSHNFDYVLSHTGPNRINEMVFYHLSDIDEMKFMDKAAALNDKIDGKITCKQWFCGHWHKDKYYYDPDLQRGYQYLYRTTALLRDDKIIPPLSDDNAE